MQEISVNPIGVVAPAATTYIVFMVVASIDLYKFVDIKTSENLNTSVMWKHS